MGGWGGWAHFKAMPGSVTPGYQERIVTVCPHCETMLTRPSTSVGLTSLQIAVQTMLTQCRTFVHDGVRIV